MPKKMFDIFKLIFLLIIFFSIGSIFSLIFTKLGFNLSTFTYADSAYADALIELVLTIIIVLLYYKLLIKDWNEFRSNLKQNLKKCFLLFGILLGVKVIASVATSILSILLGIEFLQSDNQNILELLIGSAPVIMLISSVVLAPFVEEGIFRLGFKKVINNSKIFILISGLIFGLMHIFPTDLSLKMAFLQSITYISLGLVLAYMYEKNNNIFFVIIAHALNNLLGILAALILL